MTRSLPYFKCYPQDFLHGTRGMNREDFANYVRLIFLMYEQGGPIRFDAFSLRRLLGYRRSTEVVSNVQRLIDFGKLSLDADGRLHNGRTDYEMERAAANPAAKQSPKDTKYKTNPAAKGAANPAAKGAARIAKKPTNSSRARAPVQNQNQNTSTNVDVGGAERRPARKRANKPKNSMIEEIDRRMAALKEEQHNGDDGYFLLPPESHH